MSARATTTLTAKFQSAERRLRTSARLRSIDEFVYQYTSFALWRNKVQGKSDDEKIILAESGQVWSCYSVLNVLYSLIQKSKIQDQLKAQQKGEDME